MESALRSIAAPLAFAQLLHVPEPTHACPLPLLAQASRG